MEISDDLNDQIHDGMKISKWCKADVIRQTLKIGLPQFAARLILLLLWLEGRIREALAEPAEELSVQQFRARMRSIADGR